LNNHQEQWPDLSSPDLQATIDALQLSSQVIGKIRLMMTPWLNHSWHIALYPSTRGFTTGLIPHASHSLEIEFDLISDAVVLCDSNGNEKRVALKPQSISLFYANIMRALEELAFDAQIDPMPCELPGATPFNADTVVRNYDGDIARAYWRALLQATRVFQLFRTRFLGKCSPVHLFWGGFDLAVSRFSGRTAPPHPGGMAHVSDAVARDAYNREVSSAGFWAGGGAISEPSFYSYAYPAPSGLSEARILPTSASYNVGLGEFLLPYRAVRESSNPDETLLQFLQSTYEVAADLAKWDRTLLERETGTIGRPPIGV
jgi:hypothetical protein